MQLHTLGNILILQLTGTDNPFTKLVNISRTFSGSFRSAAPIPPCKIITDYIQVTILNHPYINRETLRTAHVDVDPSYIILPGDIGIKLILVEYWWSNSKI